MTRSKDEVYGTVRWDLQMMVGGIERDGGRVMNETVWMCDQMRAGQLYTRNIFDTQAEAEEFRRKMLQHEPDAVFAVEAVAARQVWN